MKIENISEKEYKQYKSIVLNFTNGFPRIFARVIKLNQSITIHIGWDSETIKPSLLKVDNFLLIGIDFKVAIIDLEAEILSCLLPLYSEFTKFITLDDAIIILSEVEVYILNKNRFSIRNRELLPDMIEDYEIVDRTISLQCMDGSSEKVEF